MVASNSNDADRIFTYVNQMALRLFELDWDTLMTTPSRKSAEPTKPSVSVCCRGWQKTARPTTTVVFVFRLQALVSK